MRAHGLGAALLSIALLASMFAAVHRGAAGRTRAAGIRELDGQRQALEAQRTELLRRIATLGSRARVIRAAATLGLRLPNEGELVILDVRSGEEGP